MSDEPRLDPEDEQLLRLHLSDELSYENALRQARSMHALRRAIIRARGRGNSGDGETGDPVVRDPSGPTGSMSGVKTETG